VMKIKITGNFRIEGTDGMLENCSQPFEEMEIEIFCTPPIRITRFKSASNDKESEKE